MIAPAAFVVIIFFSLTSMTANGAIGLNWGRESAQRLVPSMVVDLLLQNGVPQARIYTSQPDILEAFSGSGIHLTVSILNPNSIGNKTDANDWVQKRLQYLGPHNIRRIYVGNFMYVEPPPGSNTTEQPILDASISAMKLLQDALNEAGRGNHVKTNMPIPYNILKRNITKPSDAEFSDDIKPYAKEIIDFLAANESPFIVQMFPIDFLTDNNLDPEFAFIGGRSHHVVVDDANGAVYTNVFEFMYDSFCWALEKAGASSEMDVIVGHIGWPTDGYAGANASTAERFYQGLLPFVTSGKGTPMRPGRHIDTYVHSLTDEPKNPAYQPYARHWGIYRSNGEPKYKIDLTGQGRDIFPTRARGIQRMPNRWCTFNGNMSNLGKVYTEVEKACVESDCTATAPGGSCSGLSFERNVSYAFNMFFQSKFQNESACLFEGLGHVVPDNPSVGTCVFPVEVVKGRQLNIKSSPSTGDGERLHPHEITGSRVMLLLVILLSILLVL